MAPLFTGFRFGFGISIIRNFTNETVVYNDQNPTPGPYTTYSSAAPAYDGDDSTYSGNVFPGDAGTQTGFTAITTFNPPLPVISSVIVFALIQNGTNFYVNGSQAGLEFTEFFTSKLCNVTSYVGGPGGTLQSLRWGYNVGKWNQSYFLPYYIEVDGVRLIDNVSIF
jgi:hypothetical protein